MAQDPRIDARIDAYLATLPPDQRVSLQELRTRIARTVPDAVETISYGMPAFKLDGRGLIWPQALAWRMRRHELDPAGSLSIDAVVRRLCGVQAQVASSVELAVRVRQRDSLPGDVGRALSEGGLIKTWAMRGALHLLTPEEGGTFLSLMAAGRSWERPSWQRYFGMTPAQIEGLRDVVR